MNYLKFYTDGACKNNGQNEAKAGLGIYCKTNIKGVKNKYFAAPYENEPTNNRAELTAILFSLKVIKKIKEKIPEDTKISICTDSKYSFDSITKWMSGWKKRGWKKADNTEIKNPDIFLEIDKYMDDDIKFEHTKSHTKMPKETSANFENWYGNDVADRLANIGVLMINNDEIKFIPNEMDKKMNSNL